MEIFTIVLILVIIIFWVSSVNRNRVKKEKEEQAERKSTLEEIEKASHHNLNKDNYIYSVDFRSMDCSYIDFVGDPDVGAWRHRFKLYRTIDQEWFVQLIERDHYKDFRSKIFPPYDTEEEKSESLTYYIEDRKANDLPEMSQNQIAEYKSIVEEINTKQRWTKLYHCPHWHKDRPPKAVWLDDCYRIFIDGAERYNIDIPNSTTDMDIAVRNSYQESLSLYLKMFEFKQNNKATVCSCCGLLDVVKSGTICRWCLKDKE